MKSGKKRKRIVKKVSAPKIEMNNKKNISVNTNTKIITEEELKIIIQMLEGENLEIKRKCYSQNTPIIRVKQRKFTDLIKVFFEVYFLKNRSDEHNFSKLNI